MISTVTDWAEVIGLLAIALGVAYIVFHSHGIGWGAIAFGAVILGMSAAVAALARRDKGGVE